MSPFRNKKKALQAERREALKLRIILNRSYEACRLKCAPTASENSKATIKDVPPTSDEGTEAILDETRVPLTQSRKAVAEALTAGAKSRLSSEVVNQPTVSTGTGRVQRDAEPSIESLTHKDVLCALILMLASSSYIIHLIHVAQRKDQRTHYDSTKMVPLLFNAVYKMLLTFFYMPFFLPLTFVVLRIYRFLKYVASLLNYRAYGYIQRYHY